MRRRVSYLRVLVMVGARSRPSRCILDEYWLLVKL